MRTIIFLFTIYLALIVLAIIYINMDISKVPVVSKPCRYTGYTLISADSAIDNCGNKIPMKHYRPFDK